MPEKRRSSAVTLQGGAVDFDKRTLDLMTRLLQFVHALGQMRFTCTGGPSKQDRRSRANSQQLLNLINQGIETLVASRDTTFEKGLRIAMLLLETLSKDVIARILD